MPKLNFIEFKQRIFHACVPSPTAVWENTSDCKLFAKYNERLDPNAVQYILKELGIQPDKVTCTLSYQSILTITNEETT